MRCGFRRPVFVTKFSSFNGIFKHCFESLTSRFDKVWSSSLLSRLNYLRQEQLVFKMARHRLFQEGVILAVTLGAAVSKRVVPIEMHFKLSIVSEQTHKAVLGAAEVQDGQASSLVSIGKESAGEAVHNCLTRKHSFLLLFDTYAGLVANGDSRQD